MQPTFLPGERFSRLVIIQEADPTYCKKGWKRTRYECQCDCGNRVIVSRSALRGGATQSCGCLKRERAASRALDLTGQKFGRLTAVERDPAAKPGRVRWITRCDCGTPTSVEASALRTGNTKSCGCLNRERQRERLDIAGQRFGQWVALEPDIEGQKGTDTKWWARCDCGTVASVHTNNLRSGISMSCGHDRAEKTRIASTKHGMAPSDHAKRHPLYETWVSMRQRCSNPRNRNYPDYGGRGIKVCARWLGREGFTNFLADMGEKPETPDGWTSRMPYWTLDRIDVNGNYEPSNCQWADPSTQILNRRKPLCSRCRSEINKAELVAALDGTPAQE